MSRSDSASEPNSSPAGPSRPAASATRLLFAERPVVRRDARRVAIGLGLLVLIGLFLLNFGIYQGDQARMLQERWSLLERRTEMAREQVRSLFGAFERQLRFIAEEGRVNAWARGAMEGTLGHKEQALFAQELLRASQVLRLRHLVILSPEGVPLAAASGYEGSPARHAELVQRVTERGRPWVADIRADAEGRRLFEIAIPMPHAAFAGRVPVLVAAAEAEQSLGSVLAGWEDLGPRAFAYLVGLQAQRVRYLTSPDPNQAVPTSPVDIGEPESRPAAMAATGIESSIEQSDPGRAPYFAVSRFLPELRWGIVGRADKSVMMAGLRATLWKLLLLDFAILLGAALLIWQWQRSYARGLAKHEMRVTQWHAERVQAILDTAFDAIVTFDRSGRVRTVNRAAETLFGRSAATIEGQPLYRILRWSGAQGESKERELPTPGVVWVANAMRQEGQAVPTEMSIGESGSGDDLLYTAIVRDIRERVEAEKRIRAFADGLEASNRRLEEVNAQLEEASRLKSEFLANTSHELRTPLNGMMGFLQLVLDGMCQTKEEEQGFLKQALQCSRHLLNLINDVLDIARIEAGKLSLDIQRVAVSSLFQEVRTVTHVQAAQKGLQLDFLEPDDPACAVRCDLGKAKQVLINLVGNSLKFTSKGSITVRAFPRPDLGHVMFEVEDTGIGIAREQQAVIFEKFAQGDGSTTRKYGGAGLGLAISRSLVELMGGVIGVASEGPGKGTRMYFSLPVWNEQGASPPPTDDGTSDQIDGPAGGPLVLIVEDDPVFRKFLTAVLHQHGYRTVEVPSAEGGWVRVRRLQPAVVVVDYALTCSEGAAIRTGWDLAQRMTGDSETRHIPVLFVTGFESQVREKLQQTAFGRKPQHLVKPIDPSGLVSKIQEMTSGLPGRGQVRILMAEDDPTVTAFVRKVLPETRYHIEIAGNGEECLHIMRTQPNGFDLLLLDLMMPGVSGYDVLRDMALSGTGAKLPVLVLTNCPEPETEEEKLLLEEGLVLEVMAKSSIHDQPKLLAEAIDRHLEASREDPSGGEVEAA